MKILFWSPRILCILAILFVSLFALDAFEPGVSFWKQILAFVIHLIPSFILIAMLIVAWKWELIGGIIIAATGLVFSPFVFIHNYQMNHSVWMSLGIILSLTFPFILVGGLFIISYFLRRKEAKKQNLSTNQ
ncbi:MAG: hypothetical protein ABIK52_03365 [Bacteroidota bacterium]